MVENTVSDRMVALPVAPMYGMRSASATSPIVSRPLPPSTVNVIGARSTATTSPMSPARSAIAPPSWPVQTLSIACSWSSEARSSTKIAAFHDLGIRTFSGMWTEAAMVRPETSTPSIDPLSTCHASADSQTPPSGFSPTQHGHSTLQVHTSSSLPSTSYAIAGPSVPSGPDRFA